jgi:APA family basic amino acid/polyamine antiporter/amino acid efflux transporter
MELKKVITVPKGIAIAVSMVIGSGLFGLPGLAIGVAGPYTALISWIGISILMLPMIILFSELGVRYASSAGLAQYAEVAFGSWAKSGVTAVLCGTFTIGVPALTVIGSAYVCQFIGIDETLYAYPVSILFLGLTTLMNIAGVKITSYVNSVSMYLLFALIAAFIFLNLGAFKTGVSAVAEIQVSHLNLQALWSTGALLFWAFLGWENMSFGLEEFKNPKRNIPLVYFLSFGLVVVIYLALAFTVTGAQLNGINMEGIGSLTSLLRSSSLFIPLMLVMILIKIANSNAWVFGASRLIYASGKSGILPKFLGKLDKNGIPRNSLIALCLFYITFVITMYLFTIPLSSVVMLVSQNFLILYLVSIIAYFKVVPKTFYHMSIFAFASLSCLFLLTGFSFWLLYPIGLLTLGYLRDKKFTKEVMA